VANNRSSFDPLGLLKTLDRHRVTYIAVGSLARIIQGADEMTNGVDIVPAMRAENLRRLDLALDELGARRTDRKKLTPLQSDPSPEAVLGPSEYLLRAERDVRGGKHADDQVDPAGSLVDRRASDRLRWLLDTSDSGSRLDQAPKLKHDFRV